jgi:hypothetical protein
MSGEGRKLTRAELDALRAEIEAGSGDGWTATLTSIDGIPADRYVPADDENQEASS